jgi:hypothetical protein
MLASARLARRHDLLSSEGEKMLVAAVATLGPLPGLADIGPESVGSHIARDKKMSAEGIGWVLPTDDGVVVGQTVAVEEVLETFKELRKP